MGIPWGAVLGSAPVLAVYAGMNIYTGRRLFQWFRLLLPDINAGIFAGLYFFLALSLFLSFLPLPSGIRGTVRFIAAYRTGFFICLLLLFAAADLLTAAGRIIRIIPAPVPSAVYFYRGLAVVLLSAGLICYGVFNANRLIVVPYDVQLNDPLRGEMKIVMVSDLHLGEAGSEKRFESLTRGINELKPDIVCIVGDIFNDDYAAIQDPDKAIALFLGIEAAYGVYACLGNHDRGDTLPLMIDFLERSKIKLLEEEYALIDGRLALFGRSDSSRAGGSSGRQRKDITEMIASAAADTPVVVMDHNPAHMGEYGDEVDLILSGHTHGGQIFPGGLITRAMYAVDYGHYQREASAPHVIVTQGAGTWLMPVRIGTNNEIVSIRIH